MKSLDLIIPIYNPPNGWVENLRSRVNCFKESLKDVETNVILVNDGSPHGFNPEEVEQLLDELGEAKLVSYVTNRGKGHAIREGMKMSNSEYSMFTDIDLPYTLESMLQIARETLKGNADVVVGVRGEAYYKQLPSTRVRLSKALRVLASTLLSLPVSDTQAGLKGFNSIGKECLLQTTIPRYLFDLEMIFLAGKQNLNVQSVEVELNTDVQMSRMSLKIIGIESINFLKVIFRNLF